jgi:hypothetical protein
MNDSLTIGRLCPNGTNNPERMRKFRRKAVKRLSDQTVLTRIDMLAVTRFESISSFLLEKISIVTVKLTAANAWPAYVWSGVARIMTVLVVLK